MISIEGRGDERQQLIELSKNAGWLINSQPARGCLFHVAPGAESPSRAAQKARADGIPIASYAEWRLIAADLASAVRREIAARVPS